MVDLDVMRRRRKGEVDGFGREDATWEVDWN